MIALLAAHAIASTVLISCTLMRFSAYHVYKGLNKTENPTVSSFCSEVCPNQQTSASDNGSAHTSVALAAIL